MLFNHLSQFGGTWRTSLLGVATNGEGVEKKKNNNNNKGVPKFRKESADPFHRGRIPFLGEATF